MLKLKYWTGCNIQYKVFGTGSYSHLTKFITTNWTTVVVYVFVLTIYSYSIPTVFYLSLLYF